MRSVPIPDFLLGLSRRPRERGSRFSDLPLSFLAGICPCWIPCPPPWQGVCVEGGAGAPVRNQQAREQMLGTGWKSISVFQVSSASPWFRGIVTCARVWVQAKTAQERPWGRGGVLMHVNYTEQLSHSRGSLKGAQRLTDHKSRCRLDRPFQSPVLDTQCASCRVRL